MDDDDGHPVSNNVVILLIAMGSAAFVVSMYHVIAICLCNNQRSRNQNPEAQHPVPTPSAPSIAHMIPTHKYHKEVDLDHQVSGDTCAVCLGDFEEGEELRTLPECMHSFHVSCIDAWLSSHSSCPVCRASATPSLEMQHSDIHYLSYAHQHTVNMPQFDVQSGFLIRR